MWSGRFVNHSSKGTCWLCSKVYVPEDLDDSSFETSLSTYQTTRCHNPERHNLNSGYLTQYNVVLEYYL